MAAYAHPAGKPGAAQSLFSKTARPHPHAVDGMQRDAAVYAPQHNCRQAHLVVPFSRSTSGLMMRWGKPHMLPPRQQHTGSAGAPNARTPDATHTAARCGGSPTASAARSPHELPQSALPGAEPAAPPGGAGSPMGRQQTRQQTFGAPGPNTAAPKHCTEQAAGRLQRAGGACAQETTGPPKLCWGAPSPAGWGRAQQLSAMSPMVSAGQWPLLLPASSSCCCCCCCPWQHPHPTDTAAHHATGAPHDAPYR